MFADVVTVRVKAGKGGNGLTSWRREKFVAKGGPDGGDGGHGGSLILEADQNLDTLASFRHNPLLTAEAGQNGKRRRQHGKTGKDTIIKVPVGTVVWDDGNQLVDMTAVGQQKIVAKGGRGGFGNAHFSSSSRQAPQVSEIGEPGEEFELRLELKLIADVGIVGLPNAGKSTLLSVISNAKPEIADYPFTTLAPNLGVADIDGNSLLMADIPGLIAGASKGKGLGDTFLRHIERTAVLIHLIDSASNEVVKDYQTINQELKAYKAGLETKPQLVVLTKADALDKELLKYQSEQLQKSVKTKIYVISAVAHDGLDQLLRATLKLVKQERKKAMLVAKAAKPAIPVISLADDPNAWWVEKKQLRYVVRGQKIEGFAKRTDFKNRAGMNRLRDIMHKLGIDRELVRLDIKVGDTVEVSGKIFQW
jgi:GTPase